MILLLSIINLKFNKYLHITIQMIIGIGCVFLNIILYNKWILKITDLKHLDKRQHWIINWIN